MSKQLEPENDANPRRRVSDAPFRCSFCLLVYNQEKFAAEAVRSALGQTYNGKMEILISDNCSSDKTFEIVKKTVADYNGPHEIVVNRNERNLGIIGNMNKCFELARGEWLIIAHGDDISLPERTTVLMEEADKDTELRGIGSEYYLVDENGKRLREEEEQEHKKMRRRNRCFTEVSFAYVMRRFDLNQYGMLTGAVAAWHKDCFKKFGEIPAEIWADDALLSIRARLAGKLRYLTHPLVHYRTGGVSNSGEKHQKNTKRKYQRNIVLYTAIAADIFTEGRHLEIARKYQMTARHLRNYINWETLCFREKMKTAVFFIRRGIRKFFILNIPKFWAKIFS
jgi:glycosyltransferase involved in cell wall biosynthesis